MFALKNVAHKGLILFHVCSFPDDHSRVILECSSEESTDYINADHIDVSTQVKFVSNV